MPQGLPSGYPPRYDAGPMADPVLVDIRKVQVVFQGPTNLPEDQYVNNWYFRNDDPLGNPAAAIKIVLDRFYTGVNPNGNFLSNWIAGYVNNAFTFKIYDLGQAPPRVPQIVAAAPLPNTAGSAMPAEVAACASFYAGTSTPRRRGRHYIGPLTVSAGENNPADSEMKLNLLFRTTLTQAYMDVQGTSQNVTWVMVSKGGTAPPLEAPGAYVVTAGWVDDAFDIQRRRGRKAQARTTWTA